jgi:hypothetical protein
MSLSHIRTIRTKGGKPALVRVIVGTPPAWAADNPLTVTVGERANPKAMDWLPLRGVWVTLHWLSGSRELVHGVVDALEAVEAKLFAATGPEFAQALIRTSDDEEAAQLARQDREALCTA